MDDFSAIDKAEIARRANDLWGVKMTADGLLNAAAKMNVGILLLPAGGMARVNELGAMEFIDADIVTAAFRALLFWDAKLKARELRFTNGQRVLVGSEIATVVDESEDWVEVMMDRNTPYPVAKPKRAVKAVPQIRIVSIDERHAPEHQEMMRRWMETGASVNLEQRINDELLIIEVDGERMLVTSDEVDIS